MWSGSITASGKIAAGLNYHTGVRGVLSPGTRYTHPPKNCVSTAFVPLL
jgi:hypothetical protein